MVLLILLSLILGTLEVARALYLFNTVQEVTRAAARMASITDFSDAAAMDALKRNALFGRTALPLAPEIGTAQLRIEYLAQSATGDPVALTQMPACPERNIVNCAQNPQGTSCIAFVRASICVPGGDCTALPYRPLTTLLPRFADMHVPIAATLVKAERLGYQPGTNNCL
ncbi:TadE/TadG family type IV pilus assembly protein [Pseudoduganella flava]|nr:TadE/TadG family type IV pilus assembly protein [Pseudoduganella flava]